MLDNKTQVIFLTHYWSNCQIYLIDKYYANLYTSKLFCNSLGTVLTSI